MRVSLCGHGVCGDATKSHEVTGEQQVKAETETGVRSPSAKGRPGPLATAGLQEGGTEQSAVRDPKSVSPQFGALTACRPVWWCQEAGTLGSE